MPSYRAKIVFRRHQISKKTGLAQCVMRVSIDSAQFFISTGVYIEAHQWSAKRERVNRKSPLIESNKDKQASTADMNLILEAALARANEIFVEYRLRHNLTLTKEIFLQEYHNPASRSDFLAFMENAIQDEVNRGQLSKATEDKHLLTLRKLRKFRKQILFSHLSRRLILQFDEWHFNHLKITQKRELVADGQNTRINAIKVIAKYLRIARQDKIKFEWPIYEINLTQKFEERTYLNPDELFLLLNLYKEDDPSLPPNWNLVLRYFLFSCYTGLAFSDMRDLTWENNIYWKEKRLQYIRNKTSKHRLTINIPLCLQAQDLLKDSSEALPGKGTIFQTVSEQKTSQTLKKMMSYLGINKNISTHTARHSFAACFLILGGKLMALKKLMGHKKIETTMVYAHLTDRSVEDQIEATFDKIYQK